MPTLYTMPGTCSLAPNIAVAWLNAPVEIHNLPYGEHKKGAYLAINPQGKVPALKFEDGDVLTEATAILAFLGAKYGGEEAQEYQRDQRLGRKEAEALSYMSSEVHAAYGPHFAVSAFADSDSAREEVKRHAYQKLADHFQRMNSTLKDHADPWYLGQRSFADTYLYVLTRWLEQSPLSIEDYPALKRHRTRMEADEGVRLALKRQEMQAVG